MLPAFAASGLVLLLLPAFAGRAAGPLRFRAQEIEPNLGIGYAVAVAEMNGDGKPDILAVNEKSVAWYENPGAGGAWARHVMVPEGATPRDNVCIAAADLDGDRRAEVAMGAFWAASNTQNSGSVHWLQRPPGPGEAAWRVVNLEAEPTVHRMRWADVDGDGKKELVVVPLQGRGTKGPDWMGSGVRIMAYRPPADPAGGTWKRELADEALHVVHNLCPVQWDADRAEEILVASFEGVHLLDRAPDGSWSRTRLASGDQESRPNRGSSEIRLGTLREGRRYLATVEPWHGNAVVVYTPPLPGQSLWQRRVLDPALREGHAVWCSDLDGDGRDELVVGWRGASPTRKPGVALYVPAGDGWDAWDVATVDDGGMACEDLTVADLNGDGRGEIIASGRGTHNLRIYWNER